MSAPPAARSYADLCAAVNGFARRAAAFALRRGMTRCYRRCMHLGRRIKERRESIGMTQADLAARARVTQSAVSYWEAEARTPQFGTLARVARALKCSIADLVQ